MTKSKPVHQHVKRNQIEDITQNIDQCIFNKYLRHMTLVAECPVSIETKGQSDTYGIQQCHRGLMPHPPLGNQKIHQE